MAKKGARGARRANSAGWRVDAAAVMRSIRSSLASRAEPGAFSAFIKKIRHRASDGSALPLHEDPDSVRFLRRLGVVSPSARAGGSASSKAGEETVRFFEEAARSGGPGPAVASVLVRAFASGLYGIVREAACGDVPACGECPLAGVCRERNAPGDAIREYAPGERPSERLEAEGAESLSSEELLAVLAACGSPAKEGEAAAACAELLREKGGLRALANKRPADTAKAKGLTSRGARAISAAMELARRWAAEPRPVGKAFRGGADFHNHYRLRLRDLKKEVFVSVLLDQKNRFLCDEVCSAGSLTSSVVHPREVFRRAVRESAAAVAFVHNHPSGDPAPSGADREITARLVEVAELLGIRLLDHVIVGDSTYFSFFDEGEL